MGHGRTGHALGHGYWQGPRGVAPVGHVGSLAWGRQVKGGGLLVWVHAAAGDAPPLCAAWLCNKQRT